MQDVAGSNRNKADGNKAENDTSKVSIGDPASDGRPEEDSPQPNRTMRRGWRTPPRRTATPVSKSGVRLELRDGKNVGVDPRLIDAACQAMTYVLEEIKQRAWKGYRLEAARFGRDGAPELSIRHLDIPASPTAPDEEEKR